MRHAYPGIGATALAIVAMLALAAPATAQAAKPAKPVFGVVPQDGVPPAEDLDLMPGGGIRGLRTMLPWAAVEHERGTYDWRQADAIIRETTNRGIQPFVFLYGTPDWAARIDKRDCSPAGTCAVYPPRTKTTRAAFAEFAAAAAERYGPGGTFWETPVQIPTNTSAAAGPLLRASPNDPYGEGDGTATDCDVNPELCVPEPPPTPPPPQPVPGPPPLTEPPCGCDEPSPIAVWQIWNEQNSFKYFAPQVNVRRYAGLLKSAAGAIRAVDPAAEIVLGGMWGPRSARDVVMPTTDYLEKLYALGAGEYFDSIAIHPYADSAGESVAQLQSAHRLLDREGDRKAGIWVTEIGWASSGPANNPYVKGLNGQARTLTRALSAYERKRRILNLRGVFWYSWRDKKGGDAICDWCGHAGLRTKRGEPKPAWRAFVRVAR